MTTTNKFNPETRKALVKALTEILGTKSTYLGMPSAAYQIGEYHIAKDGLMTGPDNSDLMAALPESGFEPEAPEADSAAEATAEPEAEAKTAPAKPDKRDLSSLYIT